ncbi:TrbC/VirB2 family protein [Paenibacillus taichungensis]
MFKKLFVALSLMFCLISGAGFLATPAAHAATPGSVIDSDISNGSIYDPNNAGGQKENIAKVNKPLKLIVQIFGGVGGTCFVLAVMYYAVMIIFGSLNPQKAATYWKALLGCAAGAFVFFGAATFADVIAKLAIAN